MSDQVEIELLFVDRDWPFRGLHEVADPLDDALVAAGAGDVMGGGIGGGFTRLKVVLSDRERGLSVLRRTLFELGAPASTRVVEGGERRPLYESDGPSQG